MRNQMTDCAAAISKMGRRKMELVSLHGIKIKSLIFQKLLISSQGWYDDLYDEHYLNK